MKMLPMSALALVLAPAFAVHAQTAPAMVAATVSIQQLASTYLRCAEQASNAVMDPRDAMHCGMVADALRDRAFGGSFERLLAWWHAERERALLSQPRAEAIQRPM